MPRQEVKREGVDTSQSVRPGTREARTVHYTTSPLHNGHPSHLISSTIFLSRTSGCEQPTTYPCLHTLPTKKAPPKPTPHAAIHHEHGKNDSPDRLASLC